MLAQAPQHDPFDCREADCGVSGCCGSGDAGECANLCADSIAIGIPVIETNLLTRIGNLLTAVLATGNAKAIEVLIEKGAICASEEVSFS